MKGKSNRSTFLEPKIWVRSVIRSGIAWQPSMLTHQGRIKQVNRLTQKDKLIKRPKNAVSF